jgi:stalled ribosome rescue protein Dom34
MSQKNKKQFGVWMDSHHATVVGSQLADERKLGVLCHAENAVTENYGNERTANNTEKTLLHKFFREISTHIRNTEEIHVTGTGTAQEQFINYLAVTPQFRNIIAKESTSNKMSDEKLIEFFAAHFN